MLVILVLAGLSEGRTLIVDYAGSGDSKTLAGAVFLAEAGDTILVSSGQYSGTYLNRSVALKGMPGATINGGAGSALIVSAPGCEIYGLTLEAGGSSPAVSLLSSGNVLNGCDIRSSATGVLVSGGNNTLSETSINCPIGVELNAAGCRLINDTLQGDTGIRLKNAAENEILGCKISSTSGIEIESSRRNRVINNTFSGMGFGVVLTSSEENQVSNNDFSGQYVSAIDTIESQENDLSGNRISGGKIGISLRRSNGIDLSSNHCINNERAGIYSDSSFNCTVKESELSGCGNGILLSGSGSCLLQDNRAFNGTYGISLRGSVGTSLRNNSLYSNRYNLRVDAGEVSSTSLAQTSTDFYRQDIDSSNQVEGRPVYYMVGEKGREISGSCGFLGLVDCDELLVTNQSISNSSAGILMVNSTGCRVKNSSISSCEDGMYILKCRDWVVESTAALRCRQGFSIAESTNCLLEKSLAGNCSDAGYRGDDSLNLTFRDSSAESCGTGILLKGSRLCSVLRCSARQNQEDGVLLSSSHKCLLAENQVSMNDRGLSLSGSNSCTLMNNSVADNAQDGLSFSQLTGAEVIDNRAKRNGQGIFVQSSRKLNISGNELSSNLRYGLRMSGSRECNVSENKFSKNEISGANLVDCSGNMLYHNIFIDNGFQNAVDNGDNSWDAGSKVGGNYWSDHAVSGNPGSTPRQIPSKGLDRYPFQYPWGWR